MHKWHCRIYQSFAKVSHRTSVFHRFLKWDRQPFASILAGHFHITKITTILKSDSDSNGPDFLDLSTPTISRKSRANCTRWTTQSWPVWTPSRSTPSSTRGRWRRYGNEYGSYRLKSTVAHVRDSRRWKYSIKALASSRYCSRYQPETSLNSRVSRIHLVFNVYLISDVLSTYGLNINSIINKDYSSLQNNRAFHPVDLRFT